MRIVPRQSSWGLMHVVGITLALWNQVEGAPLRGTASVGGSLMSSPLPQVVSSSSNQLRRRILSASSSSASPSLSPSYRCRHTTTTISSSYSTPDGHISNNNKASTVEDHDCSEIVRGEDQQETVEEDDGTPKENESSSTASTSTSSNRVHSIAFGVGTSVLMVVLMISCLFRRRVPNALRFGERHAPLPDTHNKATSVAGRAGLQHMTADERLHVMSVVFRPTTFSWTNQAAATASGSAKTNNNGDNDNTNDNDCIHTSRSLPCSSTEQQKNNNSNSDDNDNASTWSKEELKQLDNLDSIDLEEANDGIEISWDCSTAASVFRATTTNAVISLSDHQQDKRDGNGNDDDDDTIKFTSNKNKTQQISDIHDSVNDDVGDDDIRRTCCICLLEYEKGDQVMYGTSCSKHYFHVDCCMEWLANHDRCPYCHQDMMTPTEMLNAAMITLGKERVKKLNKLSQLAAAAVAADAAPTTTVAEETTADRANMTSENNSNNSNSSSNTNVETLQSRIFRQAHSVENDTDGMPVTIEHTNTFETIETAVSNDEHD